MVATTNYHDISLVAIGCVSKKAPFDKKKTYKYTSSLNNKFKFVKFNTSIISYIGRFAYPFYVMFLQYKRSNPSSPMVTDEFDLL